MFKSIRVKLLSRALPALLVLLMPLGVLGVRSGSASLDLGLQAFDNVRSTPWATPDVYA